LEAGKKMKKRKPPSPALVRQKQSRTGTTEDDGVMRWVERKPFRTSATGPPGPSARTMSDGTRSDSTPKTPKVKARGRLNRAVLAMLGKGLEDCFDEVRKQEVPERFKLLLQQF
jgi:hypothetical protein